SYRSQRQNRFARFLHRLNRFLETGRGCSRAKMSTVIDDNGHAGGNSCPTDSRDKCFCVYSARADADSFRLGPRTAYVTDVDIVYARGDIKPGLKSYSDVVAAGCVEF